jgi:hypothetical protein
MKYPFFTLITLLLLTKVCSGQTIFVGPAGKDTNPGTSQKPLATLSAARDKARLLRKQSDLKAPVEIIIKKGEYRMKGPLMLTADDSGTLESPLIFKGETGSMPVFSGGKTLGKFEKVNEGLWKMDIAEVNDYGWYFEQLFINGKRAQRAQVVNDLFIKQVLSVKETVVLIDSSFSHDFAVQKVTLPIESMKWLNGLSKADLEDAVVTFYHNWDNTRRRISAYSAKDTAIYVTGQGQKPWNGINSNSLFNLENIKSALDAPGEWFLERSGTLYYKPLPGETIEQTKAVVPVCEQLIVITGDEKQDRRVSNIRFENLSFQMTKYQMPRSGEEPAQGAHHIGTAVVLDNTDQVSFVNCEIAHTGGGAIWYRKACTNGRVERCFLRDLGASGVKVGELSQPLRNEDLTRFITVDNNIMSGGGMVFPCAVAVMIFNASDNEITHNEINNYQYSGVSVGWTWGYSASPAKRNKIAFNHIHHLGWGVLSDMGGVYTLGASEGTVVNNNVIHHIYSFDYGGWGLYTDEGSTGILMENNLVYNCRSSGFHQHYGKENIIRNNIFANNINAQLQATRIEKHRSFSFTNNIIYFNTGDLLSNGWDEVNILTDQNCYWDPRSTAIKFKKQSWAAWQASGKDVHSVIADPGFRNVKAFDFTLTNPQSMQQIGFKPFDYSLAGVYGSAGWKAKARLDPALERVFDEVVTVRERDRK